MLIDRELQLAEDELLELERKLDTMSLERCVKVSRNSRYHDEILR